MSLMTTRRRGPEPVTGGRWPMAAPGLVLAMAVLVAPPGAALAAEPGILGCAEIKDDMARLACFDGEVVKLRQAREAESRDSVTFFGLFGGRSKTEGAEAEKPAETARESLSVPKVTEVTATIVSVSQDGGGHAIIITDNGQVWRTIEADVVRGAREGAEVHIRTSSFNGFRLTVTGRSGEYRVTRIL